MSVGLFLPFQFFGRVEYELVLFLKCWIEFTSEAICPRLCSVGRFLKIYFIYLFIYFQRGGREGEREGEKHR